ncbi:enoyl-CoA hydratase/isomerase family protein [Bradyrhizobium sp. Arg62]|uniref:enoyl-CoA hydratase/isomerase family protein n=1 Tax=Bradyrhizobium brasilense TaxID=1419277 RepID=UPI001E2C7AE7|nr:enoyl-CoA hydratase/isomerase family protein [Bradyrhizobium brasilense]MCC8947290.1 enoyl-CoA hydratase/isomerase family protein [Bradyrhizobium brasilense]
MEADDALLIERDGDVVTMTMNRPPANALNNALVGRLLDTFRALSREVSPPGIVLTGQGERFFSAGGDIKEVAGIEISRPRMRSFHALLCEMERYPGPFVCAVRGYAVGGALEFLLHADYVVANRECKVGFPEINHGLLPAAKGIRKAVQKLGLREAQALLYWGDLTGAQRALQIGAINEIASTAEVMVRAREVCRYLRGKERKLFAAIKRSLNLTGQMDDAALEAVTIEDLAAYLVDDSSAQARSRFLSKQPRKA